MPFSFLIFDSLLNLCKADQEMVCALKDAIKELQCYDFSTRKR